MSCQILGRILKFFRTAEPTKSTNIFQTHAPRPAPRLSRTPGRDVLVPAPVAGQHTVEILKQCNFDDNTIQGFIAEKTVFQSPEAKL